MIKMDILSCQQLNFNIGQPPHLMSKNIKKETRGARQEDAMQKVAFSTKTSLSVSRNVS